MMKSKKKYANYIIFAVMVLGAFIMIAPFIWMVLTAFKTVTESTSLNPFVVFPSKWRLDAFKDAWSKMDFVRLYLNTILMLAGRIVCAVVTATMAGYAFGRLNFRGKNVAFHWFFFR